MKNKTITIVLLLCAGVILLFLYNSNRKATNQPPISDGIATTPPTNSIQSGNYQNQYIGISFDYPSYLFVEGSNERIEVTPIPPNDPKRQSSASMGALIFVLKEGQTLKESIEKLKSATLSIEKSSVGGREAEEITSFPDGYSGSTWIYILVETKKGVLQISFLRDTNRTQIYRSIIDSIRFE